MAVSFSGVDISQNMFWVYTTIWNLFEFFSLTMTVSSGCLSIFPLSKSNLAVALVSKFAAPNAPLTILLDCACAKGVDTFCSDYIFIHFFLHHYIIFRVQNLE